MWPIDVVFGKNGAFYFRYDHVTRWTIRRCAGDEAMRKQHRAQLNPIASDTLAAVPGCAIAADQQYRETDLAIDFCKDVPPLPDAVEKNRCTDTRAA